MNNENENMETVGQLEETARKLEDVTTKLENLAEKMEGIENEAKKEESLFNKILAKKTFGILGWGFFAFVIVSLIAQEIGVTLVRMLYSGGGQIPSIMTYIVSFFPLYLVAFPVLLLIIRKLPDDGRQKEGIGLSTLLKCFCMCITIMYIGNLIGTGLSRIIGGFFGKTSTNNLAELITNADMTGTIIFVVILGPIMEEIVFRKILIDKTVKFGERNAMMLSALMFGLFHMNLFQFFYAFGIGLIFAYVYIKSRKIGYSIAFHMIINFMGSVLAVFVSKNYTEDVINKLQSGNPELVSQALTPGVIMSAVYSIAVIVLFFVGLVLLIIGRKNMRLDVNGAPFTRREEKGLVYGNFGMAFFIAACIAMMGLTTLAQLS